MSPRIVVILPTRNRGTGVLTPIAAIRTGSRQDFEICVIDQSETTSETAAAIARLDDRRIRHLKRPGLGLARALNQGIAVANAPLIALTGDDCEPAADWLALIVAAFDHDPTVGIVHGNVEPCPHDARVGFVQASLRADAVTARSVRDLSTLVGTSANMALRKDMFTALSGFDEELGVGAPLAAAEDVDLALRALAGGWAVHEDPTIRVTHLDVWPLHRRDELIHRNWFGTGAVFAKFARLRPKAACGLLGRLAQRWIGRAVGVSSALGGGRRWRRLLAFARGFLVGLTSPLDRERGHFGGSSRRRREA
jgi:GT2 family glycosyltransferase